MNQKEIEEMLKKNLKKPNGGLRYSLSPMQWDRQIKQQAEEMFKAQQIQANAERLRKEWDERQKREAEVRSKMYEREFEIRYGKAALENMKKRLKKF